MDIKRAGWEGLDKIHVNLLGSGEHGNEPSGSVKGREFLN
jgi:hypothetical protein